MKNNEKWYKSKEIGELVGLPASDVELTLELKGYLQEGMGKILDLTEKGERIGRWITVSNGRVLRLELEWKIDAVDAIQTEMPIYELELYEQLEDIDDSLPEEFFNGRLV